uniref:EMB-1 protein n=1 Tax=Solanum tuberosum TaxID=4113 RepID=M1DN53_SOLTU
MSTEQEKRAELDRKAREGRSDCGEEQVAKVLKPKNTLLRGGCEGGKRGRSKSEKKGSKRWVAKAGSVQAAPRVDTVSRRRVIRLMSPSIEPKLDHEQVEVDTKII